MVSVRVCGAVSAILGVILLCCNFSYGDAVNCYECNSYTHSRCDVDIPPASYKTDCATTYNETYVLCRKSVLHTQAGLRGKKSSETRTIRSCGWDTSSYPDGCYKRAGAGWQQITCSCGTDYCNSAPRTSFTVAAMGVLLLCVFNVL